MPDNMAAIQRLAAEEQSVGEAKRLAAIQANTGQRRDISNKIANITRAIAESGHSQALLASLSTLKSRRAELQVEYDRLQIPYVPVPALSDDQIKKQSENLIEKISAAPLEQRRQIIRSLVHKIVAERDGRTIRGLITYYSSPFLPALPETRKGELPMEFESMGAHHAIALDDYHVPEGH